MPFGSLYAEDEAAVALGVPVETIREACKRHQIEFTEINSKRYYGIGLLRAALSHSTTFL